jgi:hypothetical protein
VVRLMDVEARQITRTATVGMVARRARCTGSVCYTKITTDSIYIFRKFRLDVVMGAGGQRADKSRQERTRADKSRQEQTRADKSGQEQTRADKSRQEQTRADKRP